jgi:hypothetical protein
MELVFTSKNVLKNVLVLEQIAKIAIRPIQKTLHTITRSVIADNFAHSITIRKK